MTENIIFDFGNVLVQWHPEQVYGKYFGDEAKAWWFLRHVADLDWRQRIDAGESQDICIAEQQAKFPEYSEAIALYRDYWREMLTDEVPGMRDLINELKEKQTPPMSRPHAKWACRALFSREQMIYANTSDYEKNNISPLISQFSTFNFQSCPSPGPLRRPRVCRIEHESD